MHEYILNGSQIIAEKWENNLLVYIYDEAGSPIGLMYRNSTYASSVYDSSFSEKNLQGDVIAVYDDTGAKIGSYTYDAWGNFTTTVTSGNTTLENNIVRNYNPFRYRSYFYDTETGWYYLQSRYYVPSWGRFLSADHADVLQATPDQLTDKNLFAYCDNNPITRLDEDGEFWIQLGVGAVAGLVEQFVEDCVSAAVTGEFEWSPASAYIGSAVGGAVDALIPGRFDFLGDVVSSATSNLVEMLVDNIGAKETGNSHCFEEIFYTTTNSAITGGLFHFAPKFIKNNGGEVVGKAIARKALPKILKDAGIGIVNSLPGTAFSAIQGVIVDAFPNTHTWR